jgi:hypothetical protein
LNSHMMRNIWIRDTIASTNLKTAAFSIFIHYKLHIIKNVL